MIKETLGENKAAFWSSQISADNEMAKEKLINSETHPQLSALYKYDMLSRDTLIEFEVGITKYRGKEWISFPYETGIQLYRRENGQKVISSVKGSSPKDSLFGTFKSNQKGILILVKSPRETMLLNQLIGDRAKIVGLPSGEKSSLTKKQEEYLRVALEGINLIYVIIDTDNLNSKSISMKLASSISKKFPQKVYRVDITEHTKGAYKDVTDAIRDGKNSEYVMELLNASENINNINCITPRSNTLEIKPERFPLSIFREMPEKFGDVFKYVDRVENKDILLMASLPVIAAHMDKVFVRYGGERYSPDLYSMIIASAAAGKGYANQARQLGLRLSDFYEEENLIRSELNASQNRIGQTNIPSSLRTLFFPANSSSRALYDLLQANNGKGLIFETEIDTLLTAIGQDWGNFSDLTRKAFHHESCSLSRKGELLTLNDPRLSIFMSGTHDQFREMFKNSENGLYSRFAFYTFDSKPEWISQRPSESINQLHLYIDELSSWLLDLNRGLNERSAKLEVALAEHCWNQMDEYFCKKVIEFEEEEYPEELIANIRRSGIILTKICVVFTLLRAYHELGDELFLKNSITVQDIDFKNALTITDTILNHSFYLYGLLKDGNDGVLKNQRMVHFYNELPVFFSTKEAKKIGDSLNIPTASVGRYLSKLVSSGILTNIQHGEYAKVNYK